MQKTEGSKNISGTRRFDALLAVIIDSVSSLLNNMPAQAAASIAYYFLFSIFPLFLFVVIVLSYFVDIAYVQSEMIEFVQKLIPGAEVLIMENFLILVSVVLIVIMLVFSVVFNSSDALAYFDVIMTKQLSLLIQIFSTYVLPILFLYLAGFVLYYAIPTAKVDRSAARIAALLFAVVWRGFSIVFGRYILSPMNRYDVIYGSVTVIVLMLLFIYFTAFIILYPAHLAAAITHYKQRRAGILAAAPINPKPIQPKAPQRGKKKKSSQNSGNTRTLSDPIYLNPNIGQPPKPTLWEQIWTITKSLFRWK